MSCQAGPTAPVGTPLHGVWGSVAGGERVLLTVDTQGGARIEMDCASGRLSGPLLTDSQGKFQTTGSFAQHPAGPQRADGPTTAANARFTGELRDGALTLTVLSEGANSPQVFQLREGARVKLLRCL